MATIATVAAAAISAGASAYSASSQSQAANKAAKSAGKAHTVQLPPYANAVNKYVARLLAENANVTPPSFADWVHSGGTATFPLRDTGMTPDEMRQLGLVTAGGKTPPFAPEGQNTLTPEQRMFLGMQQFWNAGGPNRKKGALAGKPLAQEFASTRRDRIAKEKDDKQKLFGGKA